MTTTRWDPGHYLQFADERGRPFVDLIGRVDAEPRTIVDLGCGPGQLTSVLRARWPKAHVHGVDSSPEMIQRAAEDNTDPDADYELADVAGWRASAPVDLIVSNAMFQWVPNQLDVIRTLTNDVVPGGTFALQVPNNFPGPSHQLMHQIASQPPYAEHTVGLHEARGTGPEPYLALFAGLGWQADVWETTYLHVLQGDDPVFTWISATGARPVLAALRAELRERFTEEYKAALREAYPRRPWGTVLPFARVFVVARKPGIAAEAVQ